MLVMFGLHTGFRIEGWAGGASVYLLTRPVWLWLQRAKAQLQCGCSISEERDGTLGPAPGCSHTKQSPQSPGSREGTEKEELCKIGDAFILHRASVWALTVVCPKRCRGTH